MIFVKIVLLDASENILQLCLRGMPNKTMGIGAVLRDDDVQSYKPGNHFC